jgi:hypothetical protein
MRIRDPVWKKIGSGIQDGKKYVSRAAYCQLLDTLLTGNKFLQFF